MSEALRFELLGPQRAWHAERPLDLGPAKQRAVLAVLLLAGGRPVPSGQIVEAVWPDDAPVNGLNVVQKHVAGLRRVLEPERSPRTPARVLTLTDAGYVLRVPPEAVDVVRFERGVRRARQAESAGRTAEALAEVTAALELWQGEPFTGFAGTGWSSCGVSPWRRVPNWSWPPGGTVRWWGGWSRWSPSSRCGRACAAS